MTDVEIIGGGLAGCEAAWRAAGRGLNVRLWEMKPERFSPAHRLEGLGELVCSNSFRADRPENAVGLLKEEMRALGSLVMAVAGRTRVPAGGALAVDRELFSREMTQAIESHPLIELRRAEVTAWPEGAAPVVVAGGPLASEALAALLAAELGAPHLHFYDALAPIVSHDSLDFSRVYSANRYQAGEGDYLNCPMEKPEFTAFLDALLEADQVEPRAFEEQRYFEGCLPIEVMARRGPCTLTFGPMKPVGLDDPRTGRRPYAVVQLRRENAAGSLWNLVGFQTRLTRPAQEKVFRLIPGLEKAEFARFGAIHRNTYLDAPKVLDEFQRLHSNPRFFAAGPISGVEGYVESAAQGLWAGENAARSAKGLPLLTPPPGTALGALLSHLKSDGGRKYFAPSNINFGLFTPPPPEVPKNQRAAWLLETARRDFEAFRQEHLTTESFV
ncbi:MAG: methylenetetrahydrofolate--tRNA-(uracil(54)-C(5))-methyltransferase (FADH(2)-oxidizing) TrmFO [Candidatus Adiutrix sp.]|jgi:methylenetetrahydrofolate--tRNA-(uracil-5-)-methyltransferase|nr:methylenetetrahydrofolate--tRNA-(uracil(54)-C(5))-methyltransferase (FADH(2)-oxidizing) TrmFO [Candidatus Adiutrix sp.]